MKSKPTKKVEPTKPIEETQKGKNNEYRYEDYYDLSEYKMKPISDRFLEALSKEYMHWAINDDKAYKVSQFHIKKHIPPSTFQRWCRDNRHMVMAHEIVLLALGNRREIGVIEKSFEPSTVKFMMPNYDKDWKDMTEWQAKMKLENDGNSGTQIVVIEKTPDSDMVPCKSTPEEVAGKIRKKIGSDKFYGGKV